jgi:limonene-1,2-epoxide hydrolase
MLVRFAGAMQGMRVDVHRQLSEGGIVMCERTDHFTLRGQAMTLPICGVFEIADGCIKRWRDYFDMSRFPGQEGAETRGSIEHEQR